MSDLHNWAVNYKYGAARVHHPKTVEQVQELVNQGRNVKALGTRHSFNDIADTPEDLISMEHFDRVLVLDRHRMTVTVQAGITYGRLCEELNREGYALHNLASLPHISVSGACATATHGSGDTNGNLATAVSAMELVRADGSLVHLSRDRDGEEFQGAVVGLGGLGVVTSLTLDILPAFAVKQEVYERLPLSELANHFDEITSSAYSVSLFTDWRSSTFNQVWLKSRVTDSGADKWQPTFYGAMLAKQNLHPVPGHSAESCTEQMGVPGRWHERLPHFRMGFTPSNGEELQSEYLVPRGQAFEALRAIDSLKQQIGPLLLISEVRTIAADRLWMSTAYDRSSVSIHFTWKKIWAGVRKLLPRIEEQLAPFDARPHWGKLSKVSPARLRSLYERLPDFQQTLQSYDPQGKFRNAFLDRFIYL